MSKKKDNGNGKKNDEVIVLKDQLIIYDSLIKKLEFLTHEMPVLGKPNEGSYKAAEAYIAFYKKCIKKIEKLLNEGKENIDSSEINCSPTYKIFSKYLGESEYKTKYYAESFKGRLNTYNAGQKNAPYPIKKNKKEYVDYKGHLIPNSDGLKLAYKDCHDKNNNNQLCLDIENKEKILKEYQSDDTIQLQELASISDKDYKYLEYFISAFWGALIFPFMSVNLVNGNGKLIFGNFLIFLLSVVVASIFSYKIGSTFKHLARDKFMFFDNLARYYFLIPFKPFFFMKIEFVKNALEKLDNRFSFVNKVQRIEEFVYAIQSYEGVILTDEIEEPDINGKRVVNKTILKAQQMVCPKCQKAGITSNLIGLSGKNGSYAVCELHSESHIFKVDPATLELEEITTYRDKKL